MIWTAGGLALAVAIAGGVYAAQRASAANALSDHYRLAVASMGDVTESISLTGSVTRVGQESVGFPSSGLVDTVRVAVGQHVTAGQTLAAMDPTSLNQAVLDAKAQLAQAQAAVVADESTSSGTGSTSQATTRTGGSPTSSGTSGRAGSTTGSSGHGGVSATTLSSIKRLSRTIGTQVRSAGAGAQAEQRACGPFLRSGPSPAPTSSRPPRRHTGSNAALTISPTSTPAAPTTSTPPPVSSTPPPQTTSTPPPVTGTPSPTTGTPPDGAQLAACLAAVRTATTDVDHAMSTLGQLSSLVTSASKQLHASGTGSAPSTARSTAGHSTAATGSPTTDPPAPSSAASASPASPSAASPSSASGGAGRSASSGSSLSADEATVTLDQLAVTQAEQAASDATLVSPISGVVGAVGVTAGQTASSSSTITVVGAGAAQITMQTPLSDLPSLAAGQQAEISAAGGLPTLTGRITQIGILPASSSSSPTYPVTVVVSDAPQALATGTSAQVTIATHRATHVVTVPESALVMVGDGRARVRRVSGRTVSDQVVSVGAVGQGLAQITSGLEAGQTVVLADLTQPLPANQSAGGSFAGRGLVGGGGGFSGRGAGTP